MESNSRWSIHEEADPDFLHSLRLTGDRRHLGTRRRKECVRHAVPFGVDEGEGVSHRVPEQPCFGVLGTDVLTRVQRHRRDAC